MKKIIALALVLVLCLSLAACGAKEATGAKIAAQKGTTSFMYAEKLANTKTTTYDTFALAAKDMLNGNADYLFVDKTTAKSLAKEIDGLKIIEGKPNMRRDLPVPDFDDSQWDPFFAWAEKEQVPILWHVNDPETFWNPDLAPSWAKKQGWSYDDSYINNEVQYTQILNLLEKHPNLKIIFAHFFFMSAQLPRLSAILDKYPNIMVDTTPGIELYENLSANPEGAKEFFRKYGNRVTYGTDIGARSVLPGTPSKLNRTECVNRAQLAQTYLTASEPVPVKADGDFLVGEEDFALMGLGLSQEDAQKILADNFLNFVSQKPAPVVPRQILKYLRTQKILIRVMSMMDKNVKPDMTMVNDIAAFFRAQLK